MLIITGASGHIGNNLVRQLIELKIDFKVLLRREGTELAGLEIEKHIGNLYDPNFYDEHIQTGDTVIHLAGYIDLKNKDYEQSYQANFVMTKVISDICYEKDAKLIFASTTDILIPDGDTYRLEENVNGIKNNYHKTKTMGTLYIKKLQAKGLKAAILYPSAVIGINDHKGSQAGQEIYKATRKKWLPYIKGGYDFIDVIDVAKAIIKAIEIDLEGDVVLSGRYFSIRRLYLIIGKITGQKKHLIFIPKWLAKTSTVFMKSFSPMMIDIVAEAKKFNDPKTKLLIEERIPIKTTFQNIINELSK